MGLVERGGVVQSGKEKLTCWRAMGERVMARLVCILTKQQRGEGPLESVPRKREVLLMPFLFGLRR